MNTQTLVAGVYALILSTTWHGVAGLPGNWQVRETPFTGNFLGIAAGPGQLVAVGQRGQIRSSSDGVYWERMPYGTVNGDFHCVTFARGLYVAGGTLGCLLAISEDGFNWSTIQSTTGPQATFGVTYGAKHFVAVGRGLLTPPNGRLMISTNGYDWQTVVRPTTNTLRAVAFGNGRYVAVGERGTIVMSTDAITWTTQISGTEHHLRSVIFTGWEFLAGGDSSTLLTSGDGISWSTVPFSSFDIRELAACGTAVVAVGTMNGQGRAQASPDGLSWPENGASFASPLHAVLHEALGRFIAVGENGLIVDTLTNADSPINRWAKGTNGYWDEAFWSLGHLPSIQDTAITFTNAGSKTLEIDEVTMFDYPESLSVRSITVDAPAGEQNTLFLNRPNLYVPLTFDELNIHSNGSLVSYHSAIDGGELRLGGDARFGDEGQWQFESVRVGWKNRAGLTLSNGWFSANLFILGVEGPGTMNQYGGANEVTRTLGMPINGGSVYNLHGGTLSVAGPIFFSDFVSLGTPRLNIAGGTAEVAGSLSLSPGEIVLTSGVLQSDRITGTQVSVTQTGGTNRTGRIELPTGGANGRGTYLLSDGLLESGGAWLGEWEEAYGSFVQSGGVHVASGLIYTFTTVKMGVRVVQGTYTLAGGLLVVPQIHVGGAFVQSGGTNRVTRLTGGNYTLSGGLLVSSNVLVGDMPFVQTGGEHQVLDYLTIYSRYELRGGSLDVDRIDLQSGQLHLVRGLIAHPDITFIGGSIKVEGTHALGEITMRSAATIDFGTEPSVLHLESSRGARWDAYLTIENWTPGADQLYFGHNQTGLTTAQVSQIRFVNPGGFFPGIYSARITSTGEVVPVPRLITYQRSANQLVLAWPEGYRLLTATNVAGPYSLLTNAISPYTASYADPQRFFILLNEN